MTENDRCHQPIKLQLLELVNMRSKVINAFVLEVAQMDHNTDTILTPARGERIEDLQLAKCVKFVSELDGNICVIERELAKVSENGQNELCHSLEMRNDEKIHILVTLEDKVGVYRV